MVPLADFEAGMLAICIPIIALIIPIVAILTRHQRQMAEIVHQPRNNALPPELISEIHALRQEVSMLRERVNQQTITIDSLGGRLPAAEIAQRLES